MQNTCVMCLCFVFLCFVLFLSLCWSCAMVAVAEVPCWSGGPRMRTAAAPEMTRRRWFHRRRRQSPGGSTAQSGLVKQHGSEFYRGKNIRLWITSGNLEETYCQSNWCRLQSPAAGWTRPSASTDRSSPDPRRTGAFLPLWFQLQIRREIVSNRFDWAAVWVMKAAQTLRV